MNMFYTQQMIIQHTRDIIFYCATIAYHVSLIANSGGHRHHGQRIKKNECIILASFFSLAAIAAIAWKCLNIALEF